MSGQLTDGKYDETVENAIQYFSNIEKLAENVHIIKNINSYTESQLNNYSVLLINFVLFIASKQSKPLYREYFAKLAFCMCVLYLSSKSQTNSQKGGRKIYVIRNGLQIEIEDTNMIAGDVIAFVAGAQQGQAVANYQQQYDGAIVGVAPAPQFNPQNFQLGAPIPQDMVGRDAGGNDSEEEAAREFEKELTRQARKASLTRAKGINDILEGTVSYGVHGLNLTAGATAGCCCCVSLNVASQVLTNAAQSTVGVAAGAGKVLGEGVKNTLDVTPSGIKAIGSFFYGWGSYASQKVATGLEAITPVSNPTVLSPEIIEMLNTTTLEPGVVSQI